MPDSLTSFIDGSSSDNQTPETIRNWMQTVFDNHHDGTKKKQIITYFTKIIQDDDNIVRKAHNNLIAARSKLKALHNEIEHPQNHVDDLLTTVSLTPAEKNTALLALMQTSNSQIYPGTFEFTETLVINGDNIHVFGDDNGLPATNTTGGLASNTVCTKGISIQGNNITIKGVHFKNHDNSIPFDFHCITFTGATSNVSFINCIFEGPLYTNAETVWWYGAGHHLEGDVTVKNCYVFNYMHWMLMDANTESSTPQKALRNVLFTENKIAANLKDAYPGVGAIAFRGKESEPGKLAICTKNVFQFMCHEYFWAAMEVNNFQKVYVADNDIIDWAGEDVGPNTKAFFQSWSKAGIFTFQAERNRVRGVRVGYALALGNTGASPLFYGCTPESYIKITDTDHAEDVETLKVDNAVSLIYPWDGNTGPTQQVIAGQIPTIENASGTPVVTTASVWVVSAVTGDPTPPSDDGGANPDNGIDQDLTFGDPPLVSSVTVTQSDVYDPATEIPHTFNLGEHAFGYIQVNNSELLAAASVKWINLKLYSSIIGANPLRILIDQVVLPNGATWKMVNQMRSFEDGVCLKRMMLDHVAGTDVPYDSEYWFRLYFRILN